MIADVEYAHHEVAGPELNGTQLIRPRNQYFISLTISAHAILGFARSWFALFFNPSPISAFSDPSKYVPPLSVES